MKRRAKLSPFLTFLGGCLLMAAPAAVMWREIYQGLVPWFMDTVTQFYPLRWHAAALLHEGQLPLWNRTVFTGVPLLANPQWGLLYPGHWPFLLMPGGHTYSLINALHIGLLGLGVAAWLWVRGRRAGALAAGLIVQAGAWPWAHLAFGSYLQAAAWAPWMFAACDKGRSRPPGVWVLLGALAAAMQILAGAPQLVVYCQLGLATYALAGALGEPPRFRGVGRALRYIALQGLLALGLTAPQWLPTLHFMADCERGGALDLGRVVGGALSLKGLAQAWAGGSGLPEDAEHILYPGITATVLALVGLARSQRGIGAEAKRPSALPLLVLVALAGLWAWRPFVRLMHPWCPLVSHFHDPRRALFLAYLAAAALAGEGFDYLWRSAPRRDRHPATLRLGQVFILALALGECALFVAARVDIKSVSTGMFQLDRPYSTTGIGPGERFYAYDSGIQYSYNYTRDEFAQTLMPNLGALYGMEDIQGYDPFIPWRYAMFMRRLNSRPAPTPNLYPSHFGLVRRPESRWLRRFGPIKARGPVQRRRPFMVPRVLPAGEVMEVPFHPPVRPPETAFTAELIAAAPPQPGRLNRARIEATYYDGSRRMSLRTFFLPYSPDDVAPQNSPRINPDVWPPPDQAAFWVRAAQANQVVHSGAKGRITRAVLKNTGPVPVMIYSFAVTQEETPYRAILPGGVFLSDWEEPFAEPIEILRIDAPAASQRQEYERRGLGLLPNRVRIEMPADAEIPPVPARHLRGWSWRERRANRLAIRLPAQHEGGWLVLSEPWARGWQCRIDGQPTPIRVADIMFRAVAVPPGAKTLTMRYRPPGLMSGLVVCAVSLILAAIYLLRPRRRGDLSSHAQDAKAPSPLPPNPLPGDHAASEFEPIES